MINLGYFVLGIFIIISNKYSQLFIISEICFSFLSITETNIDSNPVVIVVLRYWEIFQFISLKNFSPELVIKDLYLGFFGLFLAITNVKLSDAPWIPIRISKNGKESLNKCSRSISRGSDNLKGWNNDIKLRGHNHWSSSYRSFPVWELIKGKSKLNPIWRGKMGQGLWGRSNQRNRGIRIIWKKND